MQGLWRNDFEGSQFCPAPAKTCGYLDSDKRAAPIIWMDFAISLPVDFKEQGRGGLYAVDFIGRRFSSRGHYGHLGMFDEAVVVDRMISIKQLEAPPPPPTKAETIREMKECEAARTCIPDWDYINSMKD